MNPFSYERVNNVQQALAEIVSLPSASFVAGGTELLNWMKEGIIRSPHLVDINRLPLATIDFDGAILTIGALARMSEVASHEAVRRSFPAIAESLELSASPQLRNMASMGGNLMQRTRCPYFRAEIELPCNKRRVRSGCSALEGENRGHAIFGWNEHCVATHASDVAVVLMTLDAVVQASGPHGERSIPLAEFYQAPRDIPDPDTLLEPSELITAISVPFSPLARRSRYLKLRERASYEFALVSAGAGVELEGNRIRAIRVALGGVAHKPWRLLRAEEFLVDRELKRDAIFEALEADFAEARPLQHNGFKVGLARRAAARAIEAAGRMA